jgi:hypothetical protein
MNRTQQEIVSRLEERKDSDIMGFEVLAYVEFLDFDHAKPYLKDGTTRGDWEGGESPRPFTDPKAVMIDYLPFAWEKAKGCRGISAERSINYFQAWLWLDGNESLAASISSYEHYGKPQLVKICQYLGVDSKQWDDGIRTNTE